MTVSPVLPQRSRKLPRRFVSTALSRSCLRLCVCVCVCVCVWQCAWQCVWQCVWLCVWLWLHRMRVPVRVYVFALPRGSTMHVLAFPLACLAVAIPTPLRVVLEQSPCNA